VKRRRASGSGALGREPLFRESIASHLGYLDESVTRRIYMYILSLTPPPGKSYKGTSSSASRILTVRVADASPSPSLSLSHSLSLFLTLSLPLPCVRSLWQYPSFSPFFSHPRCRLERGRSAGGICTGTQVQGRGRSVEQASDVACTGGRGTSIKRKKGKGKEKKKKRRGKRARRRNRHTG